MGILDSYPRDNRQPMFGYRPESGRAHSCDDQRDRGCYDCCDDHCDCRCCVGPMGPRGFKGETGATGATGPGGTLLGIHAQLKTGTSVAYNVQIPFDTMVNDQSVQIAYVLNSGNFVITQPGNYYVSWSVNVNQGTAAAEDLTFGLNVGGSIVATDDAYLTRGTISGTALITVTGSPTTVQLVNKTAATTINYDAGTTVLANIVIVQVG